jgi:hypothetical protein
MTIWNGEITTDLLNNLNKNTLGDFFEKTFTEVGAD